MELFNLLSDASIWLYGNTYHVALDWIGELIKALITGVGSVGVGIILFSIILRVIVLPFDVGQRITMRKQNLKMKENQAQMEKMQKQYADDKDTYNKKVAEMYKANGMGACSSCLPMILSMVIFIVAINAFNAFSQYSNIENYNKMVNAYNAELTQYCVVLPEGSIDTTIEIDDNVQVLVGKEEDGITDKYERRICVKDTAENKYIYYTVLYNENYSAENNAYIKDAEKQYFIDVAKVLTDRAKFDGLETQITEAQAAAIASLLESKPAATEDEKMQASATATSDTVGKYFLDMAQKAVLDVYNNEVAVNNSFLWIKNIWATDASYKNPVLSYSDFKNEVSRESFKVSESNVSFNEIGKYTNAYTDRAYARVTGALTQAKSEPNGYFILIVLSIGTILLQQFVSMRSQKEQQKYGTVDGQGGSQQKMMLVIMTVMFAIFAFMYSSAFSIYMIMSNVLSLISTLVINKIVDMKERKKERRAIVEKYDRKSTAKRTSNRGAKRK